VVRTSPKGGRNGNAPARRLGAAITQRSYAARHDTVRKTSGGVTQVRETSSVSSPPKTYTMYQRVRLRRAGQAFAGRILAIDPYKRHPYLIHLDHDDYAWAKGSEMEPERVGP